MSFSKRNGLQLVVPLQIDSMTPQLKSILWNPIYLAVWDKNTRCFKNQTLLQDVWAKLFEQHIQELDGSHPYIVLQKIQTMFNNLVWYRVYDLLEMVAEYYKIAEAVNELLEKHNSAYRLQDTEVIRIVEPELLATIDHMRYDTQIANTVKSELSKAITKLSERGEIKNPYIYNEAAEAAIHMLEAYFVGKTGESTLSKGIVALKKEGKVVGTFFKALDLLYAFANDQVRHAIKEKQIQLGYSDALYILHLCLSLINYLEYPGKLFQLIDQHSQKELKEFKHANQKN